MRKLVSMILEADRGLGLMVREVIVVEQFSRRGRADTAENHPEVVNGTSRMLGENGMRRSVIGVSFCDLELGYFCGWREIILF